MKLNHLDEMKCALQRFLTNYPLYQPVRTAVVCWLGKVSKTSAVSELETTNSGVLLKIAISCFYWNTVNLIHYLCNYTAILISLPKTLLISYKNRFLKRPKLNSFIEGDIVPKSIGLFGQQHETTMYASINDCNRIQTFNTQVYNCETTKVLMMIHPPNLLWICVLCMCKIVRLCVHVKISIFLYTILWCM